MIFYNKINVKIVMKLHLYLLVRHKLFKLILAQYFCYNMPNQLTKKANANH